MRKIHSILIIASVALWPVYLYILTGGMTIYHGSSLPHMPPLKYNSVMMMVEGSLPLWNPYILTGMPLLGDGISAPFDLLNIMYLIANPALATTLVTVLQIFFGGIFMYIYLSKALQLQEVSSLLGGLLYTLNPAFLYAGGFGLDEMGPAGTIMWFPLALYFADRAVGHEKNHISYAILSGITLALAFFAGNPNLVFYIAVFISLYIIFSSALVRTKLLTLSLVSAVSLSVASIQIFPTLHTANISHRAILWLTNKTDLTGLNILSFLVSVFESPLNRILVLFGKSLDQFIENYGTWYIGLFNLFFIAIAYLKKSDNQKVTFFKVCIPLIILFNISMYYFPIKEVMSSALPFFKGMHVGRTMMLFYFSSIVVISYVFDNVIRGNVLNEHKLISFVKYGSKTVYSIVFIIIMLAVIFTLYYLLGYPAFNSYSKKLNYFLLAFIYFSFIPLFLSFYYFNRTVCAGKAPEKITGYILIGLIIINVAVEWGYSYLLTSTHTFKNHLENTAETEFLRTMKSSERIEILYNDIFWQDMIRQRKQYLGFNLPLLYRSHIAGGSHNLSNARVRIYFDAINSRHPIDKTYYWKEGKYLRPTGRHNLEVSDINLNLLNMLGIKYLFSPDILEEDFLKLKLKGDSYYIYENLSAIPRAFIVDDYEMLDKDAILNKMYNSDFDPLKKAFIEEPILYNTTKNVNKKTNQEQSAVKFISYKPNEVILEATGLNNNRLLILTDAYDKGWKAYLNDKEVKIYRVNYLFRAVQLSEGKQVVRFKYKPLSIEYGAYISFISIVFCMVFLVYDFAKDRRI